MGDMTMILAMVICSIQLFDFLIPKRLRYWPSSPQLIPWVCFCWSEIIKMSTKLFSEKFDVVLRVVFPEIRFWFEVIQFLTNFGKVFFDHFIIGFYFEQFGQILLGLSEYIGRELYFVACYCRKWAQFCFTTPWACQTYFDSKRYFSWSLFC